MFAVTCFQGMLQSSALGEYYLDLKDPDFETGFAVYHRRFSTNTNPKWPLAQPMRVLGHNGEATLPPLPSILPLFKALGANSQNSCVCLAVSRALHALLQLRIPGAGDKQGQGPSHKNAALALLWRHAREPGAQLALTRVPAGAGAGEINTIQGNLNWVSSREHSLKAPVWGGREEELLPLCNYQESDSSNLDHLAEFLVASGKEACEALMVLVPEAYNNHPELVRHYPRVQDFYEYYEGLQEGWDGPALLVFSDGNKVRSGPSPGTLLAPLHPCSAPVHPPALRQS